MEDLIKKVNKLETRVSWLEFFMGGVVGGILTYIILKLF